MQFKNSWLLWTLAITLTLGAGARADKPSEAKLGKKIENIRFIDAAGKSCTLADLKGKKATVVVFLSFDCPVSKSYSPALAEMAKRSRAGGVGVLGKEGDYPAMEKTSPTRMDCLAARFCERGRDTLHGGVPSALAEASG